MISQAAVIHVGTPPPDYHQEWVTRTVHFRDFASLSTERNVRVFSPEFMLLGNPWILRLYPGRYDNAAEGMTSLFLCNESDKAIDAEYGFIVNDGNGKQVVYERSNTPNHFCPVGNRYRFSWGFVDFASRSKLLSSLVDGALVIELHMKPTQLTQDKEEDCCVQNENQTAGKQDDKECAVCWSWKRTHAFFPCGHKCVCAGCAYTILRGNSKCPLCRMVSRKIAKIYQ